MLNMLLNFFSIEITSHSILLKQNSNLIVHKMLEEGKKKFLSGKFGFIAYHRSSLGC